MGVACEISHMTGDSCRVENRVITARGTDANGKFGVNHALRDNKTPGSGTFPPELSKKLQREADLCCVFTCYGFRQL